jgi:N-acyl-phosphatidylethanolamine-hydrolysing phospholipase D
VRERGIALGAVAVLLLLPAASLAQDATSALGPAPRADGLFQNWEPLQRAEGTFFRLRFFARRVGTSLTGRPGAPGSIENDGAFLRANHGHSVPTATWIGHSTVLVQIGGTSLLTVPTWSNRASPVRFAGPKRFVPPGLTIEDLPPIDFVVVSHNHYDHLDLETLRRLAERGHGTRFLVPLGNGELLRKNGIEPVEELDWGQSAKIGQVRVYCTPAQHVSRRGLGDERRALWSSWAMVAPERRVYFGGDTGYFGGFARIAEALGPFDLAMVPIGAYEPQAMMRPVHLDPEQAIQAARDLRARRALGIHYGTFDLSDEPLDEPPRRFRAAGEAAGMQGEDVWTLRIGETREF